MQSAGLHGVISQKIVFFITRFVYSYCVCTCDSWPVALREEWRLRVFENGVQREVCGVKRGWRIWFHVVRCTSDITWAIRPRTMGWARRAARRGEKRKT